MFLHPVLGLFLLFVLPSTAVDPTVDLPYATYRGVANDTNGVTHWLGMRYAAAPLRELRFAAPEDPPFLSGVQDASSHAPYCLGVGATPSSSNVTSEDCLYLDVFAPTNASNTSSLPVFFFIQGGGFASDANANFDGRGLVVASNLSIIVVTFNYRVGPYGFLAGSEVVSPNNGLLDQIKALRWVQQHISAFGGDSGRVCLGGDSAGAASISLLLTAYGGRDDGLFQAAAAESQSFATVLTANQSQYQYDDLVTITGCASAYPDTIECLRRLDVDQLQVNVTTIPYPGEVSAPLYSWDPVIDGDLIRDYTYRAFNSGRFVDVPTIFGDDTNGGTIFTSKKTWTLGDSNNFLRRQFPYLTIRQLKILNELYPNPNLTFPDSGPFWRQASDAYGEIRYQCPGLYLSSAYASRGQRSYNYRYNVQDPDQVAQGLGVPHTVEINAIFGPGNVGSGSVPASYLPGGSNADIVPLIQAYWVSFIKTHDPNTYRLAGSAVWEEWDPKNMNRYLFDTPVSSSRMEIVDEDLQGRCEYAFSIAIDIKQ